MKLVKEKALEDKFKRASAIVEEVFKLHLTDLQGNLANWRLRKNNVKFPFFEFFESEIF